MKSIRLRLLLGYAAIVLFAVLIVSAPFLVKEIRGMERNIRKEANLNMNMAHNSVSALFEKPQTVVRALALHCTRSELQLKQAQNDFDVLIKDDPTIAAAYFCEALKVKDGGKFYYSGGWVPASDYDQYQRSWFTDAQKSSGIVTTEPYLDVPTQSLVASVVLATHDDSGNFSGVCGLDISLKTLNDTVSKIKLSESGKSFLIDKNGIYLTNDDFSKIQNANFFNENPSFAKFKGQIGYHVLFEPNIGRKYIAAKVIDEKLGWILVTFGNSNEIYAEFQEDLYFVIVFGFASLLISLIVAFFLASKIVNPIKTVVGAVNKIASGNADLTKRLTVSGTDEISNLGNGFNKFMEKMQKIIGDVKYSKNELTRVGEDLSGATNDTEDSISAILQNIRAMHEKISNQKESVSQVYSAVNQIARTFDSFENIVESQASSVSQATSAVEVMIGNISSVNASMEKMTASFNSLRADSQVGISKQKAVNDKISEIVVQSKMLQEANKAISSLASQTNLLAMNASIEAAHAGSAGSGFAVVADEIRKLSETSSAQSKTIGKQLSNIKKSISDAVAASSESNISFEAVSKKLEQTDALVMEIQSAMEEQNAGSKQITSALNAMNDSTVDVRNSSSEMAQGNKKIFAEMKELQDAALEMSEKMEEMTETAQKIRETGSALSDVSAHIKGSILKIGEQVDKFNA